MEKSPCGPNIKQRTIGKLEKAIGGLPQGIPHQSVFQCQMIISENIHRSDTIQTEQAIFMTIHIQSIMVKKRLNLIGYCRGVYGMVWRRERRRRNIINEIMAFFLFLQKSKQKNKCLKERQK